MARVFHPLLKLIANTDHRKLVHQIQYLKAENEVLSARVKGRIIVTPKERRRLIKFGRMVGPAIKGLITVVTYRTFQRWLADARKPKAERLAKRKPGRPRKPEEVRQLVVRIGTEMGCGYAKVLGELKKLGVHKICKSTVRNIMVEAGLDPSPDRGEGSWYQFLKMHADTLWACDFFGKKIWTLGGLVDYYILFFIHLETRQVIAYPATAQPDGEWVAQQAKNFIQDAEAEGLEIGHLIHDWDTKFTQWFDQILVDEDAEIHRVGPAKPNLNAYAERFVQTIQQECLDHFIVLGEKHLNHLVYEFVQYYNHERPHMVIGKVPRQRGDPRPSNAPVHCRIRLGGLLRHYYRSAA